MTRVAIFAFEGMSLFHLSVPIAIFKDALSEKETGTEKEAHFDVVVCGEKAGQFSSSDGLVIQVEHDLDAARSADILIIPSWKPEHKPSETLLNLVRQLTQEGKLMVGLCLGAYVLAHSGVLDGKLATTHWLYQSDFVQRFPKVRFNSDPLYLIEDNVVTSAGTAAAIDCCLQLVKRLSGGKIANQVARMMVAAPERNGGQNQFIKHPVINSGSDERISKLTDHVLNNIQHPMTLKQAANECAMSVRSFSRHFASNHGVSFKQWLVNIRLNYSLDLLESKDLNIDRVAQLSGFQTEQNYRKLFKLRFKVTPTTWKKQFHNN